LYRRLHQQWWNSLDENTEDQHSLDDHPLDHHRRPRRLITPGESASSTAVAVYATHDFVIRDAPSSYPLLPLESSTEMNPTNGEALFLPDPQLCAYDSEYYAHCVFGLHLSFDQGMLTLMK
jgi:hypothetical protein